MLPQASKNQTRIGARVPPEVLRTLHRAADLNGSTLNQFLVQAALKEAHATFATFGTRRRALAGTVGTAATAESGIRGGQTALPDPEARC